MCGHTLLPNTAIFKLHPNTAIFKLHPNTAIFKFHPNIAIFKLHPNIAIFRLHPNIAICKLHPNTAVQWKLVSQIPIWIPSAETDPQIFTSPLNLNWSQHTCTIYLTALSYIYILQQVPFLFKYFILVLYSTL